MTVEQLRDLYVKDIDDALDSWVLMRRLSEEQKRRLRAQRAFLMGASPQALAELKASYDREPVRADDHDPTAPASAEDVIAETGVDPLNERPDSEKEGDE